MSPERWREVEQVFQTTMDREPRLRAAFLSEACGNDEERIKEFAAHLAALGRPVRPPPANDGGAPDYANAEHEASAWWSTWWW